VLIAADESLALSGSKRLIITSHSQEAAVALTVSSLRSWSHSCKQLFVPLLSASLRGWQSWGSLWALLVVRRTAQLCLCLLTVCRTCWHASHLYNAAHTHTPLGYEGRGPCVLHSGLVLVCCCPRARHACRPFAGPQPLIPYCFINNCRIPVDLWSAIIFVL
jgi:hypothetical protein